MATLANYCVTFTGCEGQRVRLFVVATSEANATAAVITHVDETIEVQDAEEVPCSCSRGGNAITCECRGYADEVEVVHA